MGTLRVTIAGPSGQTDLDVPGDTPIGMLLPTFLSVAPGTDAESPEGWVLGADEGPLPPERSLGDCGVADGALLKLRRVDAAVSADTAPVAGPRPAPVAELPPLQPGSPLERTDQLLPGRIGGLERLRRAAAAALTPDPRPGAAYLRARAATPPGARRLDPRPATLAVAGRPRTPAERAAEVWRETGYCRRLEVAIAAPRLRRCPTIAVVSPKGGVGKTTLTALIGSLLTHLRADRVVAVDTNPDYGSLGPTLAPGHDVFVDDLLGLLDRPDLSVTELDANLAPSLDGLMILPAPTDPARMARLDRSSYRRVIEYLQMKAGVLLLDCGTGLQDPPAQAAIICADQLVLISDAEPATATLVAAASERLLRSGAPITAVVNKLPRRGARLDVERFARAIPGARAMTSVPSHPRGAARVAAGEFSWEDEAAGPWGVPLRELAASLVAGWPALGLTVSSPGPAREPE